MKKLLVFISLSIFVGTSALAAEVEMDLSKKENTGKTLYGAASDTANTPLGKTSTGVGVGVLSDASGYAVVSQHMSGTKAYGSSYDSTAIYTTVNDVTIGTAYLSIPTVSDSTDFTDAAWKPM